MVSVCRARRGVAVLAIAGTVTSIAACHTSGGSNTDAGGGSDAGDTGGGDAGDGLAFCGDASMTIRYSFPGEAPVELCAPLTENGFNVRYAASGPGAPLMAECTLLSAGANTVLVSFPGGSANWWFRGYSSGDWFAHAGPASILIDTDLVATPRVCPGGGTSGICRYSSYAAEGGGCRFEVRLAGSTRGAREELALMEPCPLAFGPDRSVTAPTIEAMHMQAPINILTVNASDPSQPPAFECPL